MQTRLITTPYWWDAAPPADAVPAEWQKRADVVIIGGGFAGTEVAKQLEGLLSVTLIDTKDYFEFTPSVLRAVVEPKKLKTIQVPHSSFLHKDITLLQGEVTKVETTDSSVTYTSKGSQVEETLSYDYLVITSGSRYNLSFTVCFIIYIFLRAIYVWFY